MIKANSLPELSHFLLRRPYMSRKIEIVSDIKPSWNFDIESSMGVDMKWVRVGAAKHVQLYGNLPIKGELIVDPTEGKVVAKYDPPTHSVHLLTAFVRPVSYVLFMPKSLEQRPVRYHITNLHSDENMRTFLIEVSEMLLVIHYAFTLAVFLFKQRTTRIGL